MKILLIGKNGQVGWELARQLPSAFPDADLLAVDRSELDLADADAIVRVVRAARPDLIINCAAYTAVDQAEAEPQLAHAVNARAPDILAQEVKRLGALLLHYSTDYVFDGTARVPYDETAPTHPLSVYGASKLAGELAVGESGCAHLVLRTSWVYGLRGKNFLLTMRRLARERDELHVVNDQHGTPNWCGALAWASVEILRQGAHRVAERSGIYHLSCRGATTWYEFARCLLNYPEWPRVVPITTCDYPLPARRPAYGVLATAKLQATFGVVLPTWEAALQECLTSA